MEDIEYIRLLQEQLDDIDTLTLEILNSASLLGKTNAGQLLEINSLSLQRMELFSEKMSAVQAYHLKLESEFTKLSTQAEAVREQLKYRFQKLPSMNNVSEFYTFFENSKRLVDTMFATEEAQDENLRKKYELLGFLEEQGKKDERRQAQLDNLARG